MQTIVIELIRLRIEEMRRMVDDPERFHGAECQTHRDALRAIAAGCREPSRVAEAALESLKIDVRRWYG